MPAVDGQMPADSSWVTGAVIASPSLGVHALDSHGAPGDLGLFLLDVDPCPSTRPNWIPAGQTTPVFDPTKQPKAHEAVLAALLPPDPILYPGGGMLLAPAADPAMASEYACLVAWFQGPGNAGKVLTAFGTNPTTNDYARGTTLRAGGFVLIGGLAGYAGRPQMDDRYNLAWSDEARLSGEALVLARKARRFYYPAAYPAVPYAGFPEMTDPMQPGPALGFRVGRFCQTGVADCNPQTSPPARDSGVDFFTRSGIEPMSRRPSLLGGGERGDLLRQERHPRPRVQGPGVLLDLRRRCADDGPSWTRRHPDLHHSLTGKGAHAHAHDHRWFGFHLPGLPRHSPPLHDEGRSHERRVRLHHDVAEVAAGALAHPRGAGVRREPQELPHRPRPVVQGQPPGRAGGSGPAVPARPRGGSRARCPGARGGRRRGRRRHRHAGPARPGRGLRGRDRHRRQGLRPAGGRGDRALRPHGRGRRAGRLDAACGRGEEAGRPAGPGGGADGPHRGQDRQRPRSSRGGRGHRRGPRPALRYRGGHALPSRGDPTGGVARRREAQGEDRRPRRPHPAQPDPGDAEGGRDACRAPRRPVATPGECRAGARPVRRAGVRAPPARTPRAGSRAPSRSPPRS